MVWKIFFIVLSATADGPRSRDSICSSDLPTRAMSDKDAMGVLGRQPLIKEQRCDTTVVNNLKREIAKAICIDQHDAVCLQNILRGDYDSERRLKVGFRNDGEPYTGMPEYFQYVMDAGRSSYTSEINNIVSNWKGRKISAVTQDDNAFFGTTETKSDVAGFLNTAASVGLDVASVTPLVGGALTLFQQAALLYAPPEDAAPASQNNCAQYPLYVPAKLVEGTLSCEPQFSIRTPSVVSFLDEKACYQAKVLQNDMPTCNYYTFLLIKLANVNRISLRPVKVKEYPHCGQAAGTGQFSFQSSFDGSANTQDIDVGFNLSPLNHNIPAEMKTTITNHSIDDGGPGAIGNFTQQVRWGDTVKSRIVTSKPTDYLVSINSEVVGSNPFRGTHTPQVTMLTRNKETINRRDSIDGGNITQRINQKASILSAMAAACCAMPSADAKKQCLANHFVLDVPDSSSQSPVVQ